MFVNSTPHRRFTQSLGWPLSTYEILDFTLEKYGHELSVNGSTPYLFSVEPDGTAMRLWFFNDSALYFHRLLSSKLADPAIMVSQFWWHCVKRSVIKAFRVFSARKFFYFSIDDRRGFYATEETWTPLRLLLGLIAAPLLHVLEKYFLFSKNKLYKNSSAGLLIS